MKPSHYKPPKWDYIMVAFIDRDMLDDERLILGFATNDEEFESLKQDIEEDKGRNEYDYSWLEFPVGRVLDDCSDLTVNYIHSLTKYYKHGSELIWDGVKVSHREYERFKKRQGK